MIHLTHEERKAKFQDGEMLSTNTNLLQFEKSISFNDKFIKKEIQRKKGFRIRIRNQNFKDFDAYPPRIQPKFYPVYFTFSFLHVGASIFHPADKVCIRAILAKQ